MSQMAGFRSSNLVFYPYFMKITTLISIWLQLGHNGSLKFLKISIKSISLAILSYHYGSLKFLFLVNLHHFIKDYEARKDEEPIWNGEWDRRA